MAGKLIQIAPLQTYLLNGAASQEQVITLGARTYNILDAASGVLQVSVQSKSTQPASSTLNVFLLNSVIRPDDPGFVYQNVPPGGGPLTTAQIQITDTAAWTDRALFVAGFSTASTNPPASSISCVFDVHFGAGGAITIVMAVDLLIRDSS